MPSQTRVALETRWYYFSPVPIRFYAVVLVEIRTNKGCAYMHGEETDNCGAELLISIRGL